ncbi:MAG: right-handed parallel beta-helix repeat-containing protein, partial [Chloroflexales bacterium]
MAPRRQTLLLLAALVLLLVPLVLVPRAAAATTYYLVDTNTDAATTCATPTSPDSDCSLRRAIELANGDMSPSVINFWTGISGQVITIADPNIGLPALNDPAGGTTINGATDLGSTPNIEINGNNSAASVLRITSAGNVINRVSVYGFSACINQVGGAVLIDGGRNNILSNSYIGLTLAGAVPAAPTCNGVVLRGGATSNLLSGNTISGNLADGVLIQDASDNRLIGNRIGLAPTGTTLIPNQQNGVEVGTQSILPNQTLRNVIGSSITSEQNIISGNGPASSGGAFAGIRIFGINTLTTTVLSNYIGTDGIGSIDLGNNGNGVLISDGASGTSLQGANFLPLLISGNAGYGVRVTGAGVKNTTITSAYVGVNGIGGDVVGPSYLTATIRNDLGGIRVDSGPTNTSIVGGVERTIIAGNGGRGISIEGAATTTTRVEGALIGLVPISGAGTPSASLPNVGGGVVVEDARSTSVLSNTISGNSLVGLRVSRALTTTVSGNLVGVNLAGTGSLPNVGSGIELFDAGNTTLATNIISGNQAGVVLSNTLTTTVFSNTVTGNTLNGVLLHGATGSSVLSNTITANQAGGLLLETAVPTATTGTSIYTNTISGNPQFGLRLSGALTTTLRSNYVGLNLARTGTLPNLGNGIEVFDSRNTNATNSFVAGNSGAGIVISGTGTVSTTFNNTIAGLALVYDGLTSSFTLTATNTGPAVWITGGARQTTLSAGALGGGATPATPGPPGVRIENTSTVTVSSSIRIGWVPNGSASASPVARPFSTGISVTGMVSNVVIDSSLLSYNQGPGIALTGVVSNVQILANTLNYNQGPGISLPDSVSNVNILTNTLRFNRDAAIAVTGNAQRVRMLSNALSGNGAGISLARSSVLTTRPATSDTSTASLTNPNHDIDPPPVDVTTFTDPLRLHVTDAGAIDGYVITSTVRTELGVSPVSACISCTVQIFRPGPVADATPNQGFETLLTYPVNGNAVDATPAFSVTDSGRFTRQIFGGLGTIGSQLLLIATDGFGNSSEYSVFTHTTGISLTNLTGPTSHAPGDVVTYTLRLTNMGSLDVTGLRLQTQD